MPRLISSVAFLSCLFLCSWRAAAQAAADPPDEPKKPAEPKKLDDKVKEIAGTAEFLRSVPKHFATLTALDATKGHVTLLIDGERLAKPWPLVPDVEIKVMGWWGRLADFKAGDRVWVWFKTDRKKQPVAIAMLADEPSQKDINGLKPALEDFEKRRDEQKAKLRERWTKEGLPGTVAFVHVFSGEMDLLLDHETMRWARSLAAGDKVTLQADPPIKALVKSVQPWRERTQLRLVVHSLDLADLSPGQRLHLLRTPPAAEVDTAELPPDIDRPRAGKQERIEWFLASIYCTCGVAGDRCTGHFYTLASCNPNACGTPNHVRKYLGKKIDEGRTDRQIFEELLKEQGPQLMKPHLLP